MNRFKKICSFIILVTLFFTLLNTSPKIVQAGENSDNKIDAVFVLDASSSMIKSDPKNIRIDAFKLFVDMCHVSGDSIGLVAFGESLTREIAPVKIVNQGTKEELKKKVEGIPLSDLTDIGLGLKKAVESLPKDSANIPFIILLSDGKNDPKRSITESEKDINDAIEFAKQNGKPIYTIGLNVDGSVDQNLLARISNDTNGKSFIIDNAKDLPSIFGKIFIEGSKLKMIEGSTIVFNGVNQDVNIEMPDENVVEGNIPIMSDGILEIKILDSKGAEQPLDNNKIQIIKSQNYSIVKFINPESRNWILRIRGTKGKQGIFNYIYNYNLDLEAKLSQTTGLKSGDKININASLMSNGKSIADSEFYNGLTGKLIIKDNNKNEKKEIILNNTGSSFEGEYQVDEKGNYELTVRVDGKSLYRESNPVKLEFEADAPVVAQNPSKSDSSDLLNKLKDNWTLIAGGAGILLLLIILAILRKSSKKNKKKRRKNARTELERRINPEVKKEITPAREVITLSEAVKINEESSKKGETIESEAPMKKEVPDKKETPIVSGTALKKDEPAKKEFKAANGEFSGQIMITIKERDKEEALHPFFKNLMEFSNSINLSQLLSDLPEYKEIQKISFYPGTNGTLVIKNLSTALVEKNGIDIGSSEVLINNEEKVSITLKKTSKMINIQYFRKK